MSAAVGSKHARPLSFWAWVCAVVAHMVLANGLWVWTGLLPGLLVVLPLAAAVPGLIVKRSTYTAGWMTLLLVLYVAGLLSEGFSIPSRRTLAAVFASVAMIEFIALVLFVRLTAREKPPVTARQSGSS